MRRSGATLIEVLVSIFVMGVGLIALLVLFPLGALRMAQAIQDEYCAQAGGSADAVAVVQSIRTDQKATKEINQLTGIPIIDPITSKPYDVLNNPWAILGAPPPPGLYPQADSDGPSYAVLVDPAGCRAMSFSPGSSMDWVGANATTNVYDSNV